MELALVHYYAREGYPRHVQTVCNTHLRRRAGDPVLMFWRAYGLLAEGSSAEALRELANLQHVPEVELAVLAAMQAAHEGAKIIDTDAIAEISTRLELEEKSASEAAAVHLAAFYWHTGSLERARGTLERVLRHTPEDATASALLSWVILTQYKTEPEGMQDDGELEEALKHAEAALYAHRESLEGGLAKAEALRLQRKVPAALEVLTDLSMRHPSFSPALAERAKMLMGLREWEQVMDCVSRLLQEDPGDVLALSLSAAYALTVDGSAAVGARHLSEAASAIAKGEPKNAELCYRTARSFSRLAGVEPSVLSVTTALAERAAQLKPEAPAYHCELAYQALLADNLPLAAEQYSTAVQVDELSMAANFGALECGLLGERPDVGEAEMQLTFLEEMATTAAAGGPPHPEAACHLLYLKGLLAWKAGDVQAGLQLLERCIAKHLEMATSAPLGLDTYSIACPVRVLGIVKLMLSLVGGDPRGPTDPPSPLLAKCSRALELLVKTVGALPAAQLLRAQVHFLNGALDTAQRMAADLLRANNEDWRAHLMVCSIYQHEDKQQQAAAALEQAVGANFAVRDTPLYAIVHAKLLLASNRAEEARKLLETAMTLPGVRTGNAAVARSRGQRPLALPTLSERATIYLLLAEAQSKVAKSPNAPEVTKIIQAAVDEFRGTSEEVRVTVADSRLALERGDQEGALKKLRKVPKGSPHYTRAQTAMADIYLKHRHDRAAYIQCYLDLVAAAPDYESHCALGEAFLAIQEPEKAVRAFEMALELNPRDLELAVRVGKALVTTHDFQRAIDYFNKVIRANPGNIGLQHELAQLLIRLRQWPQAAAVLGRCLERLRDAAATAGGVSPADALALEVETWLLTAKVARGDNDAERYVEAQLRALELQRDLLARLRAELPETVSAQKGKAAGICYDLAEHYKRGRKFDQAIEMYGEALKLFEGHLESLSALAKLQLALGNWDGCKQQCVLLLKADPDNEAANIMLAEMMFHQEAYDAAIFHFKQILKKNPAHFTAMAQLVQLLRRAGRVGDCAAELAAAEAAMPKVATEAGFHFCKGLQARFTNKMAEALTEFNLARKDSRWASQALLHMVELYLNPEGDAMWAEKQVAGNAAYREDVAAARALMAGHKPSEACANAWKVAEAYALMATRDKADVEAGLSGLLDLAAADPNNVPVLLAMATGFLMLGQTPKARNQLKRVQKLQFKPDEAEEFERSWLMLADLHIQGGKYDLAQELCHKCLKHNKSCAKAYEYLGQIMEREQAYKDAAMHYENAWRYENEASPAVGYRLAFNYLKAKKMVEAVDVCHKVLKAFPQYPKIRKDVLDKARAGLRP